MTSSTTLTVRLPPEVKEQLGELAAWTRRTKSFLAGEAIAAYVARELAITEGIQRGLEDVRAGRVVPHNEAMQRVVRHLAAMPTGRRGRVAGTYERVLPGLPCIIAYALETGPAGEETLAVLRVIHGARNWPEGSGRRNDRSRPHGVYANSGEPRERQAGEAAAERGQAPERPREL